MQYREFLSLTDEEIRQIVNDIFHPKRITRIKRHKKWDEISCNIYTEWSGDEEEKPLTICDELTLSNPFEGDPLSVDFSISREDKELFTKFCLAKGVCPYLKDNPYIEKGECVS